MVLPTHISIENLKLSFKLEARQGDQKIGKITHFWTIGQNSCKTPLKLKLKVLKNTYNKPHFESTNLGENAKSG
jgi:hypothetical protein